MCLAGECTPTVPSQPALLDDSVFVATGSDLYRFTASSGAFMQVDRGFGSATAGPTVGGRFIYLAEGSSLYQYSGEDLTLQESLFLGEGVPVGYDADVTSIVTATMPSEFGLGSDHGVFVTDAEGFLTRRSPATGSIHPAWLESTGTPVPVEVATVPVVGPGLGGEAVPVLWAVDPTGLLVGTDADNGRQVASHLVGPTTQSVVLGEDGTVFVATDDLELVGYDATLDAEIIRESLAVAAGAAPVEVDGVVFVVGTDGTVRGYTAGGEVALEAEPPAFAMIEGPINGVAWAPSGDLAYVHDGDVWVIVAGADHPVNLTEFIGGGMAPAWSPDGTRLAYISGFVGSDIYVIRPDGTGRMNLTGTPSADERDPDWSPDGSRIVFSSQACAEGGGSQTERVCSGISELRIVDSITGRIRAVIGTPVEYASDREPDWSPTGDLIAFASDRSVGGLPIGVEWNLWTVAVNGTNLTPVPDEHAVGGRSPSFSTDGKRLAFSSEAGLSGMAGLYVVELESGSTARVTDLPIGAGAPSWSPDGTRLAFTWELSPLPRIYTVSVGG